jgi:hypothetical protein
MILYNKKIQKFQTGKKLKEVDKDAAWSARIRSGLGPEYANYNDQQIREIYDQGNVMSSFGEDFVAPELKELTVNTTSPYANKYPYWDQLTAEEKQDLTHPQEHVGLGTHARYLRDKATYGYGLKNNPDWNVNDALIVPSIMSEGTQMVDRTLQAPQALAVEAYEAYKGNPHDFSNANPWTYSDKAKNRRPSDIGADPIWDVFADPALAFGAHRLFQKGLKGLTKKIVSNASKKRYTNASKNAKFFDDFEKNVGDSFNKGDKATWYDDVATTADDAVYTPRSLKSKPITPLLESSDMHFDRALGKILEKDSPYLTRNFNASEFADDMSGLRVEPTVKSTANVSGVYPLYESRNTKHFSGTGAGAHSGSGNYNTMFLGNIDDIIKDSGSHLRDVNPTDTYFYNAGDKFKLTPEGVYITGDKETYNKLLQTNKRVRYSPELFSPNEHGTSQSAKLDFLNLRNKEEVLKSFDDYKRAQGMGSMLEAIESRKFLPSGFNSSAMHDADILSMLEHPQDVLTNALTSTLDPEAAAAAAKIHNEGMKFPSDWTTHNQWKNLPENIKSNEIKKLEDFYNNKLLKGKIDFKQYDYGNYKGIKDDPIIQQRFNDDYKELISKLKSFQQGGMQRIASRKLGGNLILKYMK